MSEYQYVAFRAIDGPVSKADLDFMQKQSSRATITPWAFVNEYNYGDFRGKAADMLRKGFDFHFHYANYGTRKLMIRLPHGLPDLKAADPYFQTDGITYDEDKHGPGGILTVDPSFEPGQLDDIWEFQELVDSLLPLRAEIMDGDLRPLYLAHLAMMTDMNHELENTEGPVPPGLGQLTAAQKALTELYDIEYLVAAAAKGSPRIAVANDPTESYALWIESQPQAVRNAWLTELMANPNSKARLDMLSAYRLSRPTAQSPVISLNRTLEALQNDADAIRNEKDSQRAAKAAKKRAEALAEMSANAAKYIRETEELVAERKTPSYETAAQTLADLRDALAGSDRAGLAEAQAFKLKADNPTKPTLTKALKAKGFLKK